VIDIEDTIAAVSTAPGAAAIGVVRMSGPGSLRILREIIPRTGDIEPRRVRAGWVTQTGPGERIDQVLYYFLKGPASYTGEDMVELHGHGGARNMERLLQRVLQAGARPARPGEFTLRAFLRGKMDLVRAEAVLSVVSARSEKALRAAQAQLGGLLTGEVEAIRRLIVSQLARIEASIDFPDDAGDLALESGKVGEIERRLDALAGKWKRSRKLAEGLRVALAGKPNVGKSSLFNAILGKSRALVDAAPGTTRDYIEAAVEIEGHGVTLVDTAGIRGEGGRIEMMGMQAAREVMRGADVVLLLIDDGGISAEEFKAMEREAGGSVLVPLLSKSDLGWSVAPELLKILGGHGPQRISCVTGEGIGGLEAALVEIAGGGLDLSQPLLTSVRHYGCVTSALESIRAAGRLEAEGHAEDLVASHLRSAASSMDEMTGRGVVADLLDEIFSKFCIGK
jgi:tRNA modification GTPase